MTQDEKGTPEKEPIKVAFSVPQIAGGALAAATAATIGSQLGVAGTIVGAAVASVVGGVAGTLYSAGLDRTHRKVTEAIHRGYEKVRTEDSDTRTDLSAVRGDATSLPEIGDTPTHSDLDDTIFRKDGPPAVLPGAAGRDGHPAQGSEEAKPARTVWKVAAITAGAMFVLALVVVTVIELGLGRSLNGQGGTTVSQVVRPAASASATPGTTSSPTPSPTATPTRATPTPTPAETTPAPSPTVTRTTAAPTPAATGSPGVTPTPARTATRARTAAPAPVATPTTSAR